MRLKRFTVLTVSVFALLLPLYKLVQACADGPDPYDYYPQFFPPAVAQQPAFTPFYYTAELKYYDDWYDYKADDPVPDANIAAWKAYTGGNMPAADLDSFIYAYPYAALSSLYYHIEKDKPLEMSRAAEGNTFTAWLKSSKDLEALGYLMFAKQCEPFVTSTGDWEVPTADTAKMTRLMRNGLQLQAAAKRDFFRERYAYQVLRLALYSQKYRQTLELYAKLIGDDKTAGSEIFARCLGLKAGALFRLKRKTEAAYLFSRAFDLSDNGKRKSYLSFDWATTADVRPVLALCKSPHEKAVVYLMDGLNNYEQAMPQIQAAYTADPQVKGLDVLFTREINKVEERYLQDDLLQQRNLTAAGWYYNRYEGTYSERNAEAIVKANKWKAYAATLNVFAQKAATESKTGGAAFWHLSSAYLCFIQHDATGTKRYLDMAGTETITPREHDLRDVIVALNIIRSNGRMTPKTEEELLPSVQWLDARGAKSPAADKTYRDFMSTVLAAAYLQSGDTVKAIYALARTSRGTDGKFTVDEEFLDLPGVLLERLSVEKLRELQAFVRRADKSRWDAWLTTATPYTADMLTELEGTQYLRRRQFAKAAETLGKVSPDVLRRTMLPDPFVAHTRDMMDLEADDTAHMYTKAEFAQKMVLLEGREDAASLFAYGCGLYSATYYGKAAHACVYYRSTSDELAYYTSAQRSARPSYVQDFYSAAPAEQYFVRAAGKAADNADLKAKCLWMAGKCWQKRCPLGAAKSRWELEYNDKAYYRNSLKNPYFAQLGGPLAATPFMQQAFSTCGYLRDYAKGQKK